MFLNLLKKLILSHQTIKSLNSNEIMNFDSIEGSGLGIVVRCNSNLETITYQEIVQEWNLFMKTRIYAINKSEFDVKKDYIASLFSQLSFVIKTINENRIELTFKEYKTDNLPSEQIIKVINFLKEINDGIYNPATLSTQIREDKNLYRIKTRARQDLRMLGFIDEFHQEKNNLLSKYKEATDKNEFLKELILSSSYFQDSLYILQLFAGENPRDKKRILKEVAMLIVKNSRGTNMMVESVTKERTHNLVSWLEYVNLIDYNFNPIDFSRNLKEQPIVQTNLHTLFKKILNEYLTSRQQPFGKHEMGSLVRREIRGEIEQLPFIDENYSVVGSVGQGNWAVVPWVAIMNEKITSSTQRGYYIVYLFSEDMQRLYLTFAQGVTETTREQMRIIKEKIRSTITMDSKVKKDDGIDLGQSKRARDYVESVAAYIEYQSDNLPVEEELVSDLHKMISYYEEYMANTEVNTTNYLKQGEDNSLVQEQHIPLSIPEVVDHINSYITAKGFYYEKEEVTNLYLSLKTKPFVILSGISGTGKTMLVRWFAESVGATEENGRFALIPVRPDWSDGSDLLGYIDIKGDFKEGPLTNVLKRAMQDPTNPYFVLLDEMNLARVEHYFSDLLSVMESRQWKGGEQVTSNVLPTEVTGEDLYLPSNVYLIGTVNMDETTHPFSKKVLDRANTIEFNRVQLDHLGFLKEQSEKSAMLMHNDRFVSHYLQLKDLYKDKPELIEEVTSILVKVNNILQFNGSHVGYRVRDEICFYIAYSQMHELFTFDEAVDHCLFQKILPRLAGSDTRVERVLKNLYTLFTNKEINDIEEVAPTDITDATYPKSTEKVVEMLRRLEDDGFTSFWLNS